jgi:hypothetical protein
MNKFSGNIIMDSRDDTPVIVTLKAKSALNNEQYILLFATPGELVMTNNITPTHNGN